MAVSCYATSLFFWLQSLALCFLERFEKNPVICFPINCEGLKMISHFCFRVTLKILFCTLSALK